MPCAIIGCAYMAFAGEYDQVLPPRAPSSANLERDSSKIVSAGQSSILESESAPEPEPPAETEVEVPRVLFCLGVVAAMVLLAAADLVHIDVGVLIASLLLIGTGCITVEEAMASMCVRVA